MTFKLQKENNALLILKDERISLHNDVISLKGRLNDLGNPYIQEIIKNLFIVLLFLIAFLFANMQIFSGAFSELIFTLTGTQVFELIGSGGLLSVSASNSLKNIFEYANAWLDKKKNLTNFEYDLNDYLDKTRVVHEFVDREVQVITSEWTNPAKKIDINKIRRLRNKIEEGEYWLKELSQFIEFYKDDIKNPIIFYRKYSDNEHSIIQKVS